MAVLTTLSSMPAQAEPTIKDVKEQVDTLYQQAEVAQEKVNDHKLRLADLNKDLASLESDEKRQAAKLTSARNQVRDQVVQDYQGSSLSTVSEIVLSDDPSEFLAGLSTMSSFNELQDDVYDRFGKESQALSLRRDATSERRDEIAETTAALAKEKATIDTKLDEAKKVLGKLEAKERAKLMASPAKATDFQPTFAPGETSNRAQTAIKFAMAQVGDSYVFGAAGPNSWDCSGLMMVAWAQAGVGLPHSSRMQAGMGSPVSISALQPGDLVFYYSPISHVGMYIGNGQIVHAANPGAGVKVSPVTEMPIATARRVG